MADTRGVIVSKQSATTAIITTASTTITSNPARSSWSIMNVGTAVVFVTLGATGSSTVYHYALKAGTSNDDGTGGSITQAEGVVYTGAITVTVASANPIRYVYMETI